MRRQQHVKTLRSLLEARIDALPTVAARALLESRLRSVEQELARGHGEELAEELGIISLVESCRDAHLASLDADDGLLTLGIGWQEVVGGAVAGAADRLPVLSPSRFPTCPRCAEAMVERRLRSSRRRRGKRRNQRPGVAASRVYRCLACGLVLRS